MFQDMTNLTPERKRAAIIAVAAFLISLIFLGTGFIGALLVGIIAAVAVLMIAARTSGSADTKPAATASAPAPTPAPAPAAAEPAAAPPVETAPEPVPDPDPAPTPDPEPQTVTPAPAAASTASDPLVKTGTVLAGESELAARKGAWKYAP